MSGEREPLISQTKAHAALEALGLRPERDPDPDAVAMPRAMALGYLLFTLELSALVDIDRLDQEELRAGYKLAARMLSTHNLGLAGESADIASGFTFTRLIEDRMRRTALDLADTAPQPDPKAWTAHGAVESLMNALLDLLGPASPPDAETLSEDDVVRVTRDSLRAARKNVQAARQHIESGRKTIKNMGFEP